MEDSVVGILSSVSVVIKQLSEKPDTIRETKLHF